MAIWTIGGWLYDLEPSMEGSELIHTAKACASSWNQESRGQGAAVGIREQLTMWSQSTKATSVPYPC